MADILQTGLSGLLSFQRALATTSNNVANANTPGYSRQKVDLVARKPEPLGSGFIGTGVQISGVRRIFDQYSVNQLRTANSSLGQLDSYNSLADQVDNVVGDPNTGIASGLQSFFNAWQDVSSDPSSVPARQLLIGQASSLADRFRNADTRLAGLETDVNSRIQGSVTDINSLASSIAQLNEDIVQASSGVGQPPNDLLDQRDQLITQLSTLTNINTLQEPDGSVNVFIGSGQSLVLRSQSLSLGTQLNAFDPSRLDVIYKGTNGVNQVVTDTLSAGGNLGGLLSVRTQVIDPARNTLGQVATALAITVNAQHREGMTLQGALGGDIFTLAAPQALAEPTNTGTGTATVTISDVTRLTPDDYFLRYSAGAYSLVRATDGQAVALSGAGTIASPFTAAGLSIVVGGAPANGDRILVRPAHGGASSLQTVISDPRAIAAAAPIRTSTAAANTGNATISSGEVLNVGDAGLLNTASIQFLSPTTYSVNGGGAVSYTSGGNIDINGWRVQISGTPATGDTFTVQSNAGGSGDNRNAALLGQLQTKGVLANGTTSISESFGALVGQVGTQARQASIGLDAQQQIAAQANEQVAGISGVNLDEEAADMLRWQQAYQAAAQTITVAKSLFDTLLAAVAR